MAERAPDQHTVAQRLHVGEDGGAGGGKAGYDFEQGVQIEGDLSAEGEGERAHRGDKQPSQGHRHIAVLGGKDGEAHLQPGEQEAHQGAARAHRKENQSAEILTVDQPCDHREQHQHPDDHQHIAQHIDNTFVMHGAYSSILSMLSMPLRVVTTITKSPGIKQS